MFNFATNKKIKTNSKNGFTIIESLVAIFILILSITGPMYFTQGGLRTAFVARDQITAFFLAQDAIEYIKNVRDNNALLNLDSDSSNDVFWLDKLDYCFESDGCSIDTAMNSIVVNTNQPLKINDNGFFVNSGSVNSIFKRSIKISYPGDPNVEAEITVTVSWQTHQTIGTKSIVVKENIFNWASNL